MKNQTILEVSIIDGELHVKMGSEGVSYIQLLGVLEKVKYDMLSQVDGAEGDMSFPTSKENKYDA